MWFRGCDSNRSRTTTRPMAPTPPSTTKSRLRFMTPRSCKQLFPDHIEPFVELFVGDHERDEITQDVAMRAGVNQDHAVLDTAFDEIHGELLRRLLGLSILDEFD